MFRSFSLQTVKTEYLSEDSDGKVFNDGPRGGIRSVRCGYGAQIDSIQISYLDGEGPHHGGKKTSYARTETLEDGEDIVEVAATEHEIRDRGLRTLRFKTNKGRFFEFNTGHATNGERKTFVAPEGHRMSGLHGKAGNVLNTIGVYWTGMPPKQESNRYLDTPEPDPTKPVITQTTGKTTSTKTTKPSVGLPWHYYALILCYFLLITVLFSPGWSRYNYSLGDNKTCNVIIGPWSHHTSGDDKCDPGFKDHDFTFFCHLGIEGAVENNKLEKLLNDCKGAKQGQTIALGSTAVSCIFGLIALCIKFFAWNNHAWKEKAGIIYACFSFSLLTAMFASVAWVAWMKVVDSMNTVLRGTQNSDSNLHFSILINIVGIGILVVSAFCDISAELGHSRNTERATDAEIPLLRDA